MRIVLACLVLGATLVMGAPLSATQAQTEGAIAVGVGSASCGTWLTARRDRQAAAYEQWVVGFLSGVGAYGSAQQNPLHGVDEESVWAWIDNFCRGNPLKLIIETTTAFVAAHPH
jgi:hypothetical protein